MHKPYLLPVSVKGILFEDGRVWLRKNERNEWELPGGKLDEGEQPRETAERELAEELGVQTKAHEQPVDAQVYVIQTSADEKRGVLVVSYICDFVQRTGDVEHEGEAGHAEFERFKPEEVLLPVFPMPDFYKVAIQRAARITGIL